MKKIAILGNSPAALTAVIEIKKSNPEAEFTWFSMGDALPYNRYRFASFLAKATDMEDLNVQPGSFYQQFPITLVRDAKIDRVNFKKSRIFMEDKQQYDYDALIIAGTESNHFPQIKGTQRTGVLGLRHFHDIQELFKAIPIWETVVIQGGGLQALSVAAALRQRGKEVIWILESTGMLPSVVDAGATGFIKKLLEEQGVRVIEQSAITEILGDNDVKAIRLKSGKVIGCQAVVLAETGVDLRLFKDSDLQYSERIPVDGFCQTNVPNVFAVDTAAAADPWDEEFASYLETLQQQGLRIAGKLKGEDIPAVASFSRTDFCVGDIRVDLIGKTCATDGMPNLSKIDEEAQSYFQIFLEDGCLAGAICVNHPQEADQLVSAVQERARPESLSIPLIRELLPPQGEVAKGEPAAAPVPGLQPLSPEQVSG